MHYAVRRDKGRLQARYRLPEQSVVESIQHHHQPGRDHCAVSQDQPLPMPGVLPDYLAHHSELRDDHGVWVKFDATYLGHD
jgi:hypothetical protein